MCVYLIILFFKPTENLGEFVYCLLWCWRAAQQPSSSRTKRLQPGCRGFCLPTYLKTHVSVRIYQALCETFILRGVWK